MNDQTLIQHMKSEYEMNLSKYKKMWNYYDGKHDIYNAKNITPRKNRSYKPTHSNWLAKFISEEIAYALNKPVSYTSISGNSEFEMSIGSNSVTFGSKKIELDSFGLTPDIKSALPPRRLRAF